MQATTVRALVLDPKKSKALYSAKPKYYAAWECYLNIYHAITDNISKMRDEEWKIAYGYYDVAGFPGLLARHCFILDSDNNVIDPTVFTYDPVNLDHKYYPLFTFDTFSSYLKALEEEGFMPDMNIRYRELEKDAWIQAQEHGYILIG